ncbi:ATP-binding protein [Fundidesulfovibrio terrae]|uniref:ATP-binding protein n=1 Tax=Fundidesulfovibrio terrae TaxID=2922866 RepID=UPI001FAEDBF4|nr:ATP-binding protein [Fundidesulfovibrio terrae]
MSEQLSLRIGNSLPELDRLHSEVECFLARCGVGGRTAYHIQLALDELVTNVICYAFDVQGGHSVEVLLERGPDTVDMTIRDAGKPFNPLLAPAPDLDASPEARRVGGLGIHFVRTTMDRLSYERKDGMNILHLSKKTT